MSPSDNHFSWGIVDSDGNPYIDEVCIYGELSEAEAEVDGLNADLKTPDFRVVELVWREVAGMPGGEA